MKYFLFVFFSMALFAQDGASENKKNKEIGLNVTGFIDNVFNLSGSNSIIDPYTLYFKNGIEENRYLRYGFQLQFQHELNSSNATSDRIINEYGVGFKMGYEKRDDLSSRFTFTRGIDVGVMYDQLKSESNVFSTIISTDQSISVALSPFVGVLFSISDRVYIATESFLNFSVDLNQSKAEENGTEIFKQEDTIFRLQHVLPTNLYIFFKF